MDSPSRARPRDLSATSGHIDLWKLAETICRTPVKHPDGTRKAHREAVSYQRRTIGLSLASAFVTIATGWFLTESEFTWSELFSSVPGTVGGLGLTLSLTLLAGLGAYLLGANHFEKVILISVTVQSWLWRLAVACAATQSLVSIGAAITAVGLEARSGDVTELRALAGTFAFYALAMCMITLQMIPSLLNASERPRLYRAWITVAVSTLSFVALVTAVGTLLVRPGALSGELGIASTIVIALSGGAIAWQRRRMREIDALREELLDRLNDAIRVSAMIDERDDLAHTLRRLNQLLEPSRLSLRIFAVLPPASGFEIRVILRLLIWSCTERSYPRAILDRKGLSGTAGEIIGDSRLEDVTEVRNAAGAFLDHAYERLMFK